MRTFLPVCFGSLLSPAHGAWVVDSVATACAVAHWRALPLIAAQLAHWVTSGAFQPFVCMRRTTLTTIISALDARLAPIDHLLGAGARALRCALQNDEMRVAVHTQADGTGASLVRCSLCKLSFLADVVAVARRCGFNRSHAVAIRLQT